VGDGGLQVAPPVSVNRGLQRVDRACSQKTNDYASERELGMNPYWAVALWHDEAIEVARGD